MRVFSLKEEAMTETVKISLKRPVTLEAVRYDGETYIVRAHSVEGVILSASEEAKVTGELRIACLRAYSTGGTLQNPVVHEVGEFKVSWDEFRGIILRESPEGKWYDGAADEVRNRLYAPENRLALGLIINQENVDAIC